MQEYCSAERNEMSVENPRDSSLLQSVDNALRLIETLQKNGPMGITELSKDLCLSKSTVHRLLSTLENRNYVTQNDQNSKYMLGLKWIGIGSSVLQQQKLLQIIHPYLKQLSETYNETAYLSVLNGEQMTFVDKVLSKSAIIMDMPLGSNLQPYCSAGGKVLLSHQSPESLSAILKKTVFQKYTKNTITDISSLQEELQRVRIQGYAIDNEEFETGLICYAAPIRRYSGEVIASISLSGPAPRMERRKQELIAGIMQTATEISHTLGYQDA